MYDAITNTNHNARKLPQQMVRTVITNYHDYTSIRCYRPTINFSLLALLFNQLHLIGHFFKLELTHSQQNSREIRSFAPLLGP